MGGQVPGGGRRGVAEAVQGVLGGLALGRSQAELLLHLVDDGAAAGVQQEVLKGAVELGDVVLGRHHLQLHTSHTGLQAVMVSQPTRHPAFTLDELHAGSLIHPPHVLCGATTPVGQGSESAPERPAPPMSFHGNADTRR